MRTGRRALIYQFCLYKTGLNVFMKAINEAIFCWISFNRESEEYYKHISLLFVQCLIFF